MMSLKGLPTAAAAASASACGVCSRSTQFMCLDRCFRKSSCSRAMVSVSKPSNQISHNPSPTTLLISPTSLCSPGGFISTAKRASRVAKATLVDSFSSSAAVTATPVQLPLSRLSTSTALTSSSASGLFGDLSILFPRRGSSHQRRTTGLVRPARLSCTASGISPSSSADSAESLLRSSSRHQQASATASVSSSPAPQAQHHGLHSTAASSSLAVHEVERGTNGAANEARRQHGANSWTGNALEDPFLNGIMTDYHHHHQQKPARGNLFRNGLEPTPMVQEAWELLQASTVYYCNQPVGTVAASDPSDTSPLNYDQVFIRDFIPSALAFMLSGQSEIVRNFLLYTLQLQSWEKTVDCHIPGEGLMPASFKVTQVPVEGGDFGQYEEHLDPDFGESAIGRVAPVDSGLWWIQLLRAYGRCTGDYSLQQRLDVQTGIKLILKICLADHFDMFPTLITTDGPCMIDRRLGIHGHPLEIQSLLYGALRAAREMLNPENGGAELIRAVDARLTALSFHIRQYYWLDMRKLNEIYRYKTEEYSHEAVNKFNIYPEQIPPWLMDWIPDKGGYLVGNVQPAHMDFRYFTLGNMWAVVSSLASPQQAEAVLDLVEARWEDLVGHMPLKIVHPALEGEEWRIITGSDPKNTPWSYHNGGSWPVLLWQFTAACIKMGRPHLAQRAVELAEKRLQADRWPEYYDTKSGRSIGKQARLHQTWSIAGYLASKLLLANPEAVWLFASEEDRNITDATSSFFCSTTGNLKRRRFRTSPLPPTA